MSESGHLMQNLFSYLLQRHVATNIASSRDLCPNCKSSSPISTLSPFHCSRYCCYSYASLSSLYLQYYLQITGNIISIISQQSRVHPHTQTNQPLQQNTIMTSTINLDNLRFVRDMSISAMTERGYIGPPLNYLIISLPECWMSQNWKTWMLNSLTLM